MTTIRWTEQAVADLEAIRDYVARDSGKYAASSSSELIESYTGYRGVRQKS